MKEVLYNHNNLTKEDITETIVRTKALIINSKKEVLLGYCDKIYQFLGGHLEEGETLVDCLKREIKEETGITLDDIPYNPFYKITKWCKNYPEVGKNKSYEIYYFLIQTDELPNIELVNYTNSEKEGNFEVRYVKLNEIEEVLEESASWNEKNSVIVQEMLEAFKEYKNSYIDEIVP